MVKQPAPMSNQRATGLGSVIAVAVAAKLVLGTVFLDFFVVALLVFFTNVFDAVFLTDVLEAATLATGFSAEVLTTVLIVSSDSILAAPGVASSVQFHVPLMSAQAWPVLAAPYRSVTSTILPSGSRS